MNNIKDDLSDIKRLNEFELAQYFQDNLIIRATGGDFNNELFVFARNELLKNKLLEPYLPKWLNTTRTIEQFWPLIKAKFQHYSERREYLWNEFAPLLNYLENKIVSPINTAISFDESHIHIEWEKALERKELDPEGAITSARTLLESVLKYILDEQKISYKEGIDLPELYKEVSKSLNLAPEQHQEQIFKQILSGAHSVVNGLGALRNKLGDAHGKSKSNVKPKERHSELAVNLAGSVSIFLIKTFKEMK